MRPSAQPNPFLNYEFYCVRSNLNKGEKNLYRNDFESLDCRCRVIAFEY